MASQATYFGQQPPPKIKKANTPSTTTTESSSSSTKNGVKTTKTKYITTTRTPVEGAADMDTTTVNEETRTYDDGTTDQITLTRKILGGRQYDIETILRTTTTETGSKKTKTTYATPYQELDPVTGKPIAAFNRVTHTGADHAKAPEGLAEKIALRAPVVSDKSHNIVPTVTGPGAPPAPAPAAPAPVAAPAPAPVPTPSAVSTGATSSGTAISTGGTPAAAAPAPATTTTTAGAPAPAPTTTTTVVVEEEKGCCVIL